MNDTMMILILVGSPIGTLLGFFIGYKLAQGRYRHRIDVLTSQRDEFERRVADLAVAKAIPPRPPKNNGEALRQLRAGTGPGLPQHLQARVDEKRRMLEETRDHRLAREKAEFEKLRKEIAEKGVFAAGDDE